MKRSIKFLFKQQRGGMLVEMMMTLAIAAIMIPFIFRYQQNAVERARNIAVTKQMETVQNALEKYILQNRNTYMHHAGNFVWYDVNLPVLIEANLLPEDFATKDSNSNPTNSTDFGEYALRVLKNNTVLQGVVLLVNDNITPLRTREIVNLGGGKIGYIDDTKVRGGFNVFERPKTNMGLTDDNSGLVGTTGTLRGSNEYLWRMGSDASDGAENATMASALNLDNQDIVQINNASSSRAFLNEELETDEMNVGNMLYFLSTTNLNNVNFTADHATFVNAGLYGNGGKLGIGGDLTIRRNGRCKSATTPMLNISDATTLSCDVTFKVGEGDDSEFVFGSSLSSNTLNIGGALNVIGGEENGIISPHLKVGDASNGYILHPNVIDPENPEQTPAEQCLGNYCWDATGGKLTLFDLALTELAAKLDYIQTHEVVPAGCFEHDVTTEFELYTNQYLNAHSDNWPKIKEYISIATVLYENLCKVRFITKIKYKCLMSSGWDTSNSDKPCWMVENRNYDSAIAVCSAPYNNISDAFEDGWVILEDTTCGGSAHNSSNPGGGGGTTGGDEEEKPNGTPGNPTEKP